VRKRFIVLGWWPIEFLVIEVIFAIAFVPREQVIAFTER
jgi:hypothetical protein